MLNPQKGGKGLLAHIGGGLDDLLYTIDMPVVGLLRSKTSPSDSTMAESVAAYSGTVQNYANNNPHSTGLDIQSPTISALPFSSRPHLY